MSEDSPLEDLSEQLEEVKEEHGDEEFGGSSDGDGTGGGVRVVTGDPADGNPDEPAFGTEETEQAPLFPREGTWEHYDAAIADIEAVLREHGVDDPAGREFDDAILRFAAENPEGVAALLLEARGIPVEYELE